MLTKYSIRTLNRAEFVDITSKVDEAVRKSKVAEGIAIVFCPHTTAGITINENADPSVVSDMLSKTSKLIEEGDKAYRHAEGNSDSHIKSSCFSYAYNRRRKAASWHVAGRVLRRVRRPEGAEFLRKDC